MKKVIITLINGNKYEVYHEYHTVREFINVVTKRYNWMMVNKKGERNIAVRVSDIITVEEVKIGK